jgi:Integrase zinc binding domain
MHFINSPCTNTTTDSPPVTMYVHKAVHRDTPEAVAQEEGQSYDNVPHSEKAKKADDRLEMVQDWLETLQRPDNMKDAGYKTFMQYCMGFFISHRKLWEKDSRGQHKMTVTKEQQLFFITLAHNNIRHHGFYVTNALFMEQYWWLHMAQDIVWFISTCHICQIQKTQQVLIPPTVAMPAPLFLKVYMDTMHMPSSGGYKFIILGHCSLIYCYNFTLLYVISFPTSLHNYP